MISRRLFAGCALCALGSLKATEVSAQSSTAITQFKRTVLQQVDGPTPGYVTVAMMIEVPTGHTVPRHTHPGIESGYFLEGGGELLVDGQPKRLLKPGLVYQVPVGVPHSFINGKHVTRISGTFTVEKDKPLSSPA